MRYSKQKSKETQKCKKEEVEMAMWNANAAFLNSKRKTKAYKEVPKNVRQMLNIDNVHPNGIFKIETGDERCMYDRCYIFEDINYINQDTSGKENMLLQFMGWLNSMKTDFKITLANEYRDLEQFLKEILIEPNKEIYPVLAEGMNQWIQAKVEEGSPNIRQVRYLSVTCHSKSFEDAQIYFNMLETQLERLFLGWKSRIYKLNARERLRALHAFFRMGKEEEFEYNSKNPTTDWRNNILPVHIESFPNFLILDDLYVSMLFGYKFSAAIDEGKLMSGFSNVSFPSLITLDYAPIKTQALKGKIENAHMNNEKSIVDEIERKKKAGNYGGGISYQKTKKKDELENYQDQIEENDEHGFFIGMILAVTASSEEELAQRVEHMQALGEENGVILETYNQRQLKALNTALPFGGRQVDHMRSFLTSSAVALQPYYAQDVQEAGGNCFGVNRTTRRLIIGNRKKLKNPHAIIVGHTGCGKSMNIKMEIAQDLLRTDDDISIIDPQDEFQDFVERSGGIFYELAPQSKIYVNPFEVSADVFYGEAHVQKAFIAKQSKYAKAFIGAIMRNIIVTQEHHSIIDRCVRNMFAVTFSQKKLKEQPTLRILRNRYFAQERERVTDEMEKEFIRQMYNSLEEYTEGMYDLFAHPSNVEITKRLVAFGLKKVPKDNWEPVMITIMQFLSNRMEYNQTLQKATRLIVDETQVVCKNPSSAETLLEAVVTFRKFGGICTLAFQNLSRILGNEDLRDMFSNCEYKCFLDQGGVDANELAEIQELSAREFRELANENVGQGVMVWGKKVILFDAFMEKTNVLYETISTNYHEQAENLENAIDKKGAKVKVNLRGVEKEKIERTENVERIKSVERAEKAGRIDYRKEKEAICEMAALTSLSVREVKMLLDLDLQTIKAILTEMEQDGLIEATLITGVVQYHKVS